MNSLYRHLQSHPIDCVGFDLDGTLFEDRLYSIPALVHVADCLAGRFGLSAPEIENYLIASWETQASRSKTTFADAVAHFGLQSRLQARDLVRMFNGARPHLELEPEIADLLSELEPCYRLFLVTDGDPVRQKYKVEALGLDAWFEARLFTGDAGPDAYKPNPSFLVRAAKALGVDVSRCVYVGDDDRIDGEAARKSGMTFVQLRIQEFVAAGPASLARGTRE